MITLKTTPQTRAVHSINVLPEVLQHASSGKLRILAVSGAKRSKYLPNVPTFAEAGFKDVEADEYFAVFAPAKTPADVVSKLNAAIRAATQSPRMIEGLEKLSFDVGGESTADFTQIVQKEYKRWGPIVSASGFSSEE